MLKSTSGDSDLNIMPTLKQPLPHIYLFCIQFTPERTVEKACISSGWTGLLVDLGQIIIRNASKLVLVNLKCQLGGVSY